MSDAIKKLLMQTTAAISWTDADKRYQRHHVTCQHCKAAGKVNGTNMCEIGETLWNIYEATPIPPEKLGRAKRAAGGELPPEPPINPDPEHGMACCTACQHLSINHYNVPVCRGSGHDLAGFTLAHHFVVRLQRCPGFRKKVARSAAKK
jgi:hypothetical protein